MDNRFVFNGKFNDFFFDFFVFFRVCLDCVFV